MKRILLISIIFLAVLIVAFTISEFSARRTMPEQSNIISLGSPFQLVTHEGKPITQAIFKEKASAVFFGFTHCPEICPTTLNDLSILRERLGPDADRLNIIFITVDPARDTVEALSDYIPFFGPGIIGITGPEEQVYALAKSWGIYWKKSEINDFGYNIDHTASVFMLNDKGEFKGTIDSQESREIAFLKLQKLVRRS